METRNTHLNFLVKSSSLSSSSQLSSHKWSCCTAPSDFSSVQSVVSSMASDSKHLPSSGKSSNSSSSSNVLIVFDGSFTGQLLNMSPVVTSALYTAFPIIYLLDKALAFVTWTNSDPYSNFITIAIYVMVVKYWSVASNTVLAALIALTVCVICWFLTTSIEDMRSEDEPPTVEEIIDTLSNMQARFQCFVKPLESLAIRSRSDVFNLCFSMVAITPFYIWIMTRIFNVRWFLLVVGVFALSFHSSWALATRHLIWRSVLLRRIFIFATGLRFSLEDKDVELSVFGDFQVSEAAPGKTIEFRVLENQRRWVGVGWSEIMLPFERTSFTYENLEKSCDSLDKFQFPNLPQKQCRWKWLEESWKSDKSFSHGSDWMYYNNNWEDPATEDSLTKFTRSRLWKRRAIVVLDKDHSQNDMAPDIVETKTSGPSEPYSVDRIRLEAIESRRQDCAKIVGERKRKLAELYCVSRLPLLPISNDQVLQIEDKLMAFLEKNDLENGREFNIAILTHENQNRRPSPPQSQPQSADLLESKEPALKKQKTDNATERTESSVEEIQKKSAEPVATVSKKSNDSTNQDNSTLSSLIHLYEATQQPHRNDEKSKRDLDYENVDIDKLLIMLLPELKPHKIPEARSLTELYYHQQTLQLPKLLLRAHKSLTTESYETALVEGKISVLYSRMEELKRKHSWSLRQPKKSIDPFLARSKKTHWDHLLSEMKWLSTDFKQGRRFKMVQSYYIAEAVKEYWKYGKVCCIKRKQIRLLSDEEIEKIMNPQPSAIEEPEKPEEPQEPAIESEQKSEAASEAIESITVKPDTEEATEAPVSEPQDEVMVDAPSEQPAAETAEKEAQVVTPEELIKQAQSASA
ncbi:hypothetical protein OGAPHI_001488, partial [Ogataea philodendri]